MAQTPTRQKPLMEPSDQATEKHVRLAVNQGAAFERALTAMTMEKAPGAEKRAGDYIVGYAVERAEGLYHLRNGQLHWDERKEENAHIEVVVRDASDGRFIPGLTVYATLIDSAGNDVGTHQQPFLWHPWLYHYGRNWQVPADGTYTIRLRIEAPEFGRHDKINGQRYGEPVEVEFTDVRIQTGQKKS